MVEKFRRFRLRNGSWLAYNQYGASRGKPILYFHGWPGSRLEARMADQTAKEFNATLIAIDSPGLGMSDFQPGRAILDWPADVSEIAGRELGGQILYYVRSCGTELLWLVL